MPIVHINGYKLDTQELLVQAIYAARQVRQMPEYTIRDHPSALEFIGCSYVNPSTLETLKSLFRNLQRVTIQDCPKFDLEWAYNTDSKWSQAKSLGFELRVDFAEPSKYSQPLDLDTKHTAQYRAARNWTVAGIWVW